jgi:hypothetical protein
MAINGPVHELGQYLMTYAAGQNPSTFTRMLPPAAAQVRPVRLAYGAAAAADRVLFGTPASRLTMPTGQAHAQRQDICNRLGQTCCLSISIQLWS